MKSTLAVHSPIVQVISVVSVLMTVGTIRLVGQAPKKAPAQAAQSAEFAVYPGAKLDAQTSAAISTGGPDSFFVYLSTDPAAKVAAFYETKTGKKAEKLDQNSFAFYLKNPSGMPDLTIQANLEGPLAGKTVITIVKHWR